MSMETREELLDYLEALTLTATYLASKFTDKIVSGKKLTTRASGWPATKKSIYGAYV